MTPRRTIASLSSIVALLALTSSGVCPGRVDLACCRHWSGHRRDRPGLPLRGPAHQRARGHEPDPHERGRGLHEIIVVRKNDGVTESFDELLALPEEEAFQRSRPRASCSRRPASRPRWGWMRPVPRRR